MKTTYKIIRGRTDFGTTPFWLMIEHKWLWGLWTTRKLMGKYPVNPNFGEMGDMPFFRIEEAQKRIEELKNKL